MCHQLLGGGRTWATIRISSPNGRSSALSRAADGGLGWTPAEVAFEYERQDNFDVMIEAAAKIGVDLGIAA